jgi:hypothetical protein
LTLVHRYYGTYVDIPKELSNMRVFQWKGDEGDGHKQEELFVKGSQGVPSLTPSSDDVSSDESASKHQSSLDSSKGWQVDLEKPRRGHGIGSIVRKLNCSESRRGRFGGETDIAMNMNSGFERSIASSSGQRAWRSLWKSKEEPIDDLRPVLITVEDTPVFMQPPRTPIRQTRARSLSPSRYYPQLHGSPSVLQSTDQHVHGSVQDQTGKISANFFEQYHRSPQVLTPPHPIKSKHVTFSAKAPSNRTSSYPEVPQHPQRHDFYPVLQDDNDSTANSRSVMTGLDTMGTGTSDDYTGYSSVSESEDPSTVAFRRRSGNVRGGGCSKTRLPTSETGLFAGVAEDLGVVAGMILMDGNACFTCVAETTKESVAQCRSGKSRRSSSRSKI